MGNDLSYDAQSGFSECKAGREKSKGFIAPELATTVGVLTEVPVMLMLVKIANSTKGWFKS